MKHFWGAMYHVLLPALCKAFFIVTVGLWILIAFVEGIKMFLSFVDYCS